MQLTKYPVVSIDPDEEKVLLSVTKFVFLTVNPTEREAFFKFVKPFGCYGGIVKINRTPQTYHLGIFGKYVIAYTQSAWAELEVTQLTMLFMM